MAPRLPLPRVLVTLVVGVVLSTTAVAASTSTPASASTAPAPATAVAPAAALPSAPLCGTTGGVTSDGRWQCTFDDEFNGVALDTTRWVPQLTATSGFGSRPGCYVANPANIAVADGTLRLTARREAAPFTCVDPVNGSYTTQYTAGSVSTYGLFSQTYGRFEVRAKLPAATVKGLQESFWLWPDNAAAYGAWPGSGEIDIAEAYSQYPDRAIPYIHYNAAAPDPNVTNNYCLLSDLSQFHTYAAEWTPDSITITYDGQTCLVDRWNPAAPMAKPQPFDRPYMIALTQALGLGTNAFDPATTPLPATTEVDYVRAWAPATAAPVLRTVVRVSGADRIATAVAASAQAFPASSSGTASAAKEVVLARSDAFADALAGAPLAAAHQAPLLLTPPDQLDPRTEAEIQRVLPPGGTVRVLGGQSSITDSVSSRLAADGFSVARVAGADRFATAVDIATMLGDPASILLANGRDFPDDLSAGAAAIRTTSAVLLTDGGVLPRATSDYLLAHPADQVIAIGGAAAQAAPSVRKIVGADRYATAVLVAQQLFPDQVAAAGLTSGQTFPDALAGTADIGRLGGPILLTPPSQLPTAVSDQLRSQVTEQVVIYGGAAGVSAAVAASI